MVKNTRKTMLTFVLIIAMVCTMILPVFSLSAGDSVQYPFRKSEAFVNAPTYIAPATNGDQWILTQTTFPKADLSKATYIAYEIEVVSGNPGIDFGIITQGGNRFGTHIDGQNKAFFVTQDGAVRGLTVQYAAINLGEGAKGMLLIPVSSLFNRNFGACDGMENAVSFYMCYNTLYNNNFSIKIGEVGYYTGAEPTKDSFVKLLDLSKGEKNANYIADGGYWEAPKAEPEKTDIAGKTVRYPFATGETAFDGAIRWTGPNAKAPKDNWQALFVTFDKATVDLSKATYLVVQYKATAGTPGITYAVESTAKGRYSTDAQKDGSPIYFMNEKGKISKNGNILYGAANVSSTGALLIPMSSMGWQWGETADGLKKVNKFLLTTNSFYNWSWEVVIGEIGYYTGDPTNGGKFHKLLDLSDGSKEKHFSSVSDKDDSVSTISVYRFKEDKADLGDTHIDVFATGKKDNSLEVYINGALGTQTMTKDSYGDDAYKLVTPGPRDGATDPYAAFTLIDGAKFEWAGQKGITFWARNDSDKEISFNLEFDMNHNDFTNSAGYHNARFNIRQGHRFWLYDVNTGEQQIYMTRPCITLPVGFEGWVRIPFEAYEQAEWSAAAQGTFSKELFAAEGSWVQYICITVNSQDYANKEFSVGKIGTYSTTPYLVSAWFEGSETHKTIPQLMGLEA